MSGQRDDPVIDAEADGIEAVGLEICVHFVADGHVVRSGGHTAEMTAGGETDRESDGGDRSHRADCSARDVNLT
ncbi:MAG: hypothetical protein NVSMB68_03260 [Thermoanaerobaculia bacterium]